jgi:hypothetical protein
VRLELEGVRFEEDLGPFVAGVVDAGRTTARTDGFPTYFGLEAIAAGGKASCSDSSSTAPRTGIPCPTSAYSLKPRPRQERAFPVPLAQRISANPQR